MTRLIASELYKLRKRLMTKVLLYVLVGIIIILYLVFLAVSKANIPAHGTGEIDNIQNILGLPVAIPFALMILSFVGSVLAVILVASCIGNEYNWRTMRTILICSESRFKLLGAKLIAAAIFIFIGMVIGVVTGFVMSLITTAIGGYAFGFSFATGDYLWDQFVQFWRTYFVLIPYALLGFLLAIVGRSAMPGIALGIGILFLEPFISTIMRLARGWIAQIPDYLLAANVSTITALGNLPGELGREMGGGEASSLGTGHAFITLTIYSLVFAFLAFYFFRRRDVTG